MFSSGQHGPPSSVPVSVTTQVVPPPPPPSQHTSSGYATCWSLNIFKCLPSFSLVLSEIVGYWMTRHVWVFPLELESKTIWLTDYGSSHSQHMSSFRKLESLNYIRVVATNIHLKLLTSPLQEKWVIVSLEFLISNLRATKVYHSFLWLAWGSRCCTALLISSCYNITGQILSRACWTSVRQ